MEYDTQSILIYNRAETKGIKRMESVGENYIEEFTFNKCNTVLYFGHTDVFKGLTNAWITATNYCDLHVKI